MMQYRFDTGSTLRVIDIPYFADFNTQQFSSEEIRILVDTSESRTVIIPRTTQFPIRNVKITVVDVTGNAATNNITVEVTSGLTNDYINGAATSVINADFQSSRYEVIAENQWSVLGGSNTGGSSSGFATFDITLSAARVNELLNDPDDAELVIDGRLSGQANRVVQIHTCNFIQVGGTVARDGANPALMLTGFDRSIAAAPVCIMQVDYLSALHNFEIWSGAMYTPDAVAVRTATTDPTTLLGSIAIKSFSALVIVTYEYLGNILGSL